MSEYQIKLNGWQVIVGIAVLVVILGLRLMTLNDKTDDSDLMEQLEFQLLTDYYPDDVKNLKSVYEAGDEEAASMVVESLTSRKINIESVQTSSPLLSFSTNTKVVVKVTYSMSDSNGIREKGEKYYLFKHGTIGNTWHHRYDSSAFMYYLNFI